MNEESVIQTSGDLSYILNRPTIPPRVENIDGDPIVYQPYSRDESQHYVGASGNVYIAGVDPATGDSSYTVGRTLNNANVDIGNLMYGTAGSIQTGRGLMDQINTGNTRPFDMNYFNDFMQQMSTTSLPPDDRRFVVHTGAEGMRQMEDALRLRTNDLGDPLSEMNEFQANEFHRAAQAYPYLYRDNERARSPRYTAKKEEADLIGLDFDIFYMLTQKYKYNNGWKLRVDYENEEDLDSNEIITYLKPEKGEFFFITKKAGEIIHKEPIIKEALFYRLILNDYERLD